MYLLYNYNIIKLTFLVLLICFLNYCQINANDIKEIKKYDLMVVTVATHITDGFVRFNRSVNTYGLKLEILGLNQKWLGGNVATSPGGGHKVNLLKSFVNNFKNDKNLIILFVDSYDVIITSNSDEILRRFVSMDAKIVFSSEGFCWPDKSLASKYPESEEGGKPYLNSGGFIGFAPQIYQMVLTAEINNLDDDQLFYTKIYINQTLRKKYGIKLDQKANLFQNLNGAIGDVEIKFSDDDSYVINNVYQTNPLIIHGNGASKISLNSLGNYLVKSWHPKYGCLICNDNITSFENISNTDLPLVLIGIYITHETPFLDQFFEYIVNQNYPQKRIHLYLYNSADYHSKEVQNFIDQYRDVYRGVTVFTAEDHWLQQEWRARNSALDECMKINCDYYFSIDSNARLTNKDTLKQLIQQNKGVIAPLLSRNSQLWSNFWGALSSEGFYSRSFDYILIVKNDRRGVWNVAFISECYLIKSSLFKGLDSNEVEPQFPLTYYSTQYPDTDPDMTFCSILRDKGVFMFVTNSQDFGHLVVSSTFDTKRLNPDLYEMYSNQKDWEKRYIHEDYRNILNAETQVEQPCPDVYWFPVVTHAFCKHLIEIMENFGQWSDGTNKDTRLAGGYENVPTRDIHMNQIGWEQHWLYFLREYIRPVQEKLFIGYSHDPPKAIMNFVVRYHPNEQPLLRPHHDSSTYTVNIALNSPGIDYEGGGCRFVRYNCSVTEPRMGWSFLHPGRLTHYHEGLRVTKGIRYILVSFVDP
ncbi:procollagen-lysine,2-oxoglutarate 5-dioxygenase-like [Oppia nitens]|uniref:procollagen-lysine,2-oxoglutarate 5-dioxygenase-like n=1 Tax=Oppia nitens TaxID=1686743 RepID=UPI0023DB0E5F|nr:procollagen-lysine,2-oxoglutarate 5-dioxygenase-like [Oppia nitens]